MFQFSCRFAFFINFSSFKPDAENNANFDAVSYLLTYLLTYGTLSLLRRPLRDCTKPAVGVNRVQTVV